jgi:starch synthase (maltosyl-transferring)
MCENTPREPGSEEYLDSEKYQIRVRDLGDPNNLAELIGRINGIRRDCSALQANDSLRFHPCDNERIICYSKGTNPDDLVLVVVNLDPHYTQSGWMDIPLDDFGLERDKSYQVHDLIGDARYMWQGARNYVELDPRVIPAHIFRLHRRMRTEQDFDYFL